MIYRQDVKFFLNELIDILFENEFFGFKNDAKNYVLEIITYINNHNFKTGVRESPVVLRRFGQKFIKYKANPQTTWYIFFDHKDGKYLVNHILNNHSKDFPELL